MNIPQITAEELHEISQANWPGNTALIDVRTKGEFQNASIKDAINIPLNGVEGAIEDLKKYDKIYVICHSGSRSQMACYILASKDLNNTINVAGGISGWINNGFPVI